MNWLFASGGQSIGVSASTSVLLVNTQDWSSCCPRDSQESSLTPQFKSINCSALSLLHGPTPTWPHPYMTTGKTIALTRWTFVGKVMSLLFKILFNILFLIRTVKLEETCQVQRRPSGWDGGKQKWGITHFIYLDFVFQRLHDHLFI